MTKEEIVEVIKRSIVENLDDVNEEELDPERSMRDYGANSLDIIEVVTSTMRRLNIRVPRSALAEVRNINELADKFVEYVNR
jgi:polyketide biosynthesis acyl carrier protein